MAVTRENDLVTERDATMRKPRQSRETQSVAFFQAQLDNGAPTISVTALCREVSRASTVSCMKDRGHVQRINRNLGSDKEERKGCTC